MEPKLKKSELQCQLEKVLGAITNGKDDGCEETAWASLGGVRETISMVQTLYRNGNIDRRTTPFVDGEFAGWKWIVLNDNVFPLNETSRRWLHSDLNINGSWYDVVEFYENKV